jgi:hypothetical protein
MIYTPEELAYISFCKGQITCDQSDCPGGHGCDQNNRSHCSIIVDKMKTNSDLTKDEIRIVKYFFDIDQKLWRNGRYLCTPLGSKEKCPNRVFCDKVSDPEAPCSTLSMKLGIYTEEQLNILESEVEKILVNNLDKVDWGVGEKLSFFAKQTNIDDIHGRVDVLLKNQAGTTIFVVELKPDTATREDVGQLQSYVGWYRDNLPLGVNKVKGILLAREIEPAAKYAALAGIDIMTRCFELEMKITNPPK